MIAPKFRRQRGAAGKPDRAFVEVQGQRVYLGVWKSPESLAAYDRIVAELHVAHGCLPVDAQEITVAELAVRFLRRCRVHYRRPDGTPTSELHNIRLALRPADALYGDTPAAAFGPRKLKACRQWLIEKGGSRGYVNKHVNRLRLMFRWGVEEELVPAGVHEALRAVSGLKRGRCEVRETSPVQCVPQAHIDAVRPYVSRQVQALIDLQLLTAARAGELVTMRPVDIDMSGPVWIARMKQHKTTHHGRDRLIYLGPKAKRIVSEFLAGRPIEAYLFSPAEAERERHEQCATHRHQAVGRPATDRRLGDRYMVSSYRRSIARACREADVPSWSPHRLRHNSATALRRQFGLEAAQLMLGHARADVTQLYAELNHSKAIEVAAKVG